MILLYLEGSGSKFQSVNTKKSQFCQFFGFQELRKKYVNTKTSQVSQFFGFQELRKNMHIYIYLNMYICTCVYYMILLYLEGSGSKFQSVNTKTSQFSQFFGFQELRKHMSTPKLVNFHHFLDSRSWEKKHVNTKASQFTPFFGFQELRKKHVNTKTSQCSPFFGFQELRKKHVNT